MSTLAFPYGTPCNKTSAVRLHLTLSVLKLSQSDSQLAYYVNYALSNVHVFPRLRSLALLGFRDTEPSGFRRLSSRCALYLHP